MELSKRPEITPKPGKLKHVALCSRSSPPSFGFVGEISLQISSGGANGGLTGLHGKISRPTTSDDVQPQLQAVSLPGPTPLLFLCLPGQGVAPRAGGARPQGHSPEQGGI